MNKKTISLILLLISMNLFSQVNNEMFVPLRIAYYPGTSYKIPMDDDEFKDIWVRILTFHLAYPRAALNLQSKDKEAYQRLNSRLLITRSECDTFVRNYIKYYLTRGKIITNMEPVPIIFKKILVIKCIIVVYAYRQKN